MRNRIAPLAAAAGLFLSLCAPAEAGGGVRSRVVNRINPIVFTADRHRISVDCSRRYPDAWRVAAGVWVNGREIPSTTRDGVILYFAGEGTLVRLHAHGHGGATCARVITWLPRVRVRVRWRVVGYGLKRYEGR